MDNWMQQRIINIFNQALRLLKKCKVPDLSSYADPVERAQVQRKWFDQLLCSLPSFVSYIERNQKTLFHYECGPVAQEFRKYFLMVYFEQVSLANECNWFQMTVEDDGYIEYRLSKFCEWVDCILTRNINSSIHCWFYHYYGIVLGKEGWQHRPGDVYSFCRLFHCLMTYDREKNVVFAPRVLNFVEKFGKQLITCRHIPNYPVLGLTLINTLLEYTCRKRNRNLSNSCHDFEGIIELMLPLIRSPIHNKTSESLWNIVYNCLKSLRHPDPSLDDEIMRILVALLNENEDDLEQSHLHMSTLARLLLLDVPDVTLEGFGVFTAFGRVCRYKEFHSYLRTILQGKAEANEWRFSLHWKLRIARVLPKLIARFSVASTRCYLSSHYLQELDVLVGLVMVPIGRTWPLQRAQGVMLRCLLNEIDATTRSMWERLQPIGSRQMLEYDCHLLQNELWNLLITIADCVIGLMPAVRRNSDRAQSLMRSIVMQNLGAYYHLQRLTFAIDSK